MNQIILIGEVKALIEENKGLYISIATKDYKKETIVVEVYVEKGYEKEMVKVLKTKPLLAVKCSLKLNKTDIEFVAEKMSVLKLTEEQESEIKEEVSLKTKKSKSK
jgi:hypothetical protein